MADVGLKCPFCGGHDLTPVGDVFVEAGEWDGKNYTHESSHGAWQCNDCNKGFIEWDEVASYLEAINEEDEDGK
jgi:hypothetical protein